MIYRGTPNSVSYTHLDVYKRQVMIGMSNGQIVYVPFSRAVSHDRTIDRGAVDLVRILSI